MKLSNIILLATFAFKYSSAKAVKTYDSFNYTIYCTKEDTLCSTVKQEITDAVFSLSTILDISPAIKFDAIVDDISKYKDNVKKETYATTVDKDFNPLNSKDKISSTAYSNAKSLISSFDDENIFANDDLILLLNNFDSDEILESFNYDYRNNAIKEIVKGLQSLNKLKEPYNTSSSGGSPPPGGSGKPPPGGSGGKPPQGGSGGPGKPPPGYGGDGHQPPPHSPSNICESVQRNQNNTALMEDAHANDLKCQSSRLNKLNTIINWKNKLISKGDPKETAHFKHKRLVAIGDIHGDFQKLEKVLRHAQIINNRNQWIAEDTILVQTGDLIDRGNDIKEILDLLKNLFKPARKKGCEMYLLLGNHEILNLQGQYQFTSRGDVRSFKSIDRRENAFSPTGKYGKILRGEMNVTVTVNDSLFVHAGLKPQYAQLGIDNINNNVRDILMNAPSFPELCSLSKKNITHPLFSDSVLNDSDGPLNTRDFANSSEDSICPELEKTLKITNTKRMVVGHTVQEYGEIHSRCDNKLILIDLGMSDCYGDYFGYLEILYDKNEVWAVYNN